MGDRTMGQRIIGLTGGIATGKSTVSQYLATRYHLPVLDADVFARQAVEPGSEILAAIAQRYGANILNADGSLNRQHLGRIIFSDGDEKHWVEQQIHPFVRRRFAAETAQRSNAPVIVHAIPLLFEAALTDQVTETWVVICSEDNQRRRLMARDSLTEAAAHSRIRSQWPLDKKAQLADVVIDNSSTLETLYAQVDHALRVD